MLNNRDQDFYAHYGAQPVSTKNSMQQSKPSSKVKDPRLNKSSHRGASNGSNRDSQ